MSLEYVLDPGGSNEKSLTRDDIISQNPVKTHTGKGNFMAILGVDIDEIIGYARRQDRINIKIDGSTKFTGYVINAGFTKADAQTKIGGDGIAKKLEETKPDYSSGFITYSSIALEDAIDDYWSRTPFDNYSVTSQSTEQVASGEKTQSASTNSEWSNILPSPASTDAWQNNGGPELLQSLFFETTSDADTSSCFVIDGGAGESDQAEGQKYANLLTNSQEVDYNPASPAYEIPASNAKIAIRAGSEDGASGNIVGGATTNLRFTANGDTFEIIGTPDISTYENDFEWFTFDLSNKVDSSITINVFLDGDSFDSVNESDPGFKVDVATVYDDRFTYNFDDTVDSNYHLDGPELYPDALDIELATEDVSYNISAAEITSSWDDTSTNQQLAVRLSTNSYLTTDNSSTLDKSFNNQVGRVINARLRLSRYGNRSTASPTSGFNGQSVDDYTLKTDGNNLVIIDELTLSRSHFENLQTLHEYGDFQWVIEHDGGDISNMTVTSFRRGDETRTQPDGFGDEKNKTAEVQSGAYYNKIPLQGAEDSNGDRPSATVKDSDAINKSGREISPGVLRDYDVTTKAGAIFRARSLLDAALKNNNLRGTVTIPPTELAHPGYSYPVDFNDDGTTETLTAEEVSLTESPDNVEIRYNFVPVSDISEEIRELRRNAKKQGDRV